MVRRSRVMAFALIAAALGACGLPPNQRLLTRPDNYAVQIGWQSDGEPVDLEELVADYPQLKGRVMSAPEYMAQYERDLKAAAAQGKELHPFRIPPGTDITIEITGEPDLTQQVHVGPHGYDTLKLIGDFTFVNRTIDEVRKELRERYSQYLKKPEVLVHVNAPSGYQSAFQGTPLSGGIAGYGAITVLGASQSSLQRQFRLSGGEHLVEVLGIAGLPNDSEWRAIRIIRRDEKDPQHKGIIIFCDMWDYIWGANMAQDIPIFPGDVIFVPERHSTGKQFQKDWNLILSYFGGSFSVDSFMDAFKDKGAFRDY